MRFKPKVKYSHSVLEHNATYFCEITLGCEYLSQSQPHIGAVNAYVPPLMTNISPKTTGLKLNCRKCGSKVACRNPMLTLVAIIDIDAINTPGILRSFPTPANRDKRRHDTTKMRFKSYAIAEIFVEIIPPVLWGSCSRSLWTGRTNAVMTAARNNADPSTTNGVVYPPT